MNWKDNQELEPWDIPDRPLEPNKNTPSAPSAGAQWTRSFQQNAPARPKRNVPPPRTNPRRDEFQRKLKASVSLALVAAGASQLGGVAALLPETELAARMEEFVSFPVSEEEASDDDWDTQAPADGADPAGWAQTPLPGTTLSMPLPSVITLSEDEETSRLYYDGDNYDFSMDVLWMHLGDAVYTEEEAFEALKNTLDGYGEYGDETIVQPVFTGETEDGILYAQLSVEGESGYVYAMRAFLYDDVYGLISYDRYDLDGWSEAFEDAAASCFDGLVPQA